MTEAFRPAWWLRNPHAQTIWGKFARGTPLPPVRRERWETPDGDFLDLVRMEGEAGRPRLLLLHGLEGTPRSHYVRGFFVEARRRGWAADLLLFRCCGDEPNRLLRSYHSGETGDIDLVARRLRAEDPGRPIVAAGVSLGGNVLLKWLGEQGERAKEVVVRAAAISTPYDLAEGCRHLERGFSRVYGWHFLRTLRAKAREKHARFPGRVRWGDVARSRTLWEFDDAFTAPVHGFRDAADYYARASSIGFLAGIRVPTLLLSAADDPFLPPAVLDRVRAVVGANSAVTMQFSDRGGHVGFIGGMTPWRADYYAEARAIEFLAQGDAAR